jgi:hypothetical protein
MIVSTFLNLVVIPAFYVVVADLGKRRSTATGQEPAANT